MADIRHSAIAVAGGAEADLRRNWIERAGFGVVAYGVGTTAAVADTTFVGVSPPGVVSDAQAVVTKTGTAGEGAELAS